MIQTHTSPSGIAATNLANATKWLLVIAPRQLPCHELHHRYEHRHEYGEDCPAESEYRKAYADAVDAWEIFNRGGDA